ncbi:MAG: REP-associated tyrosine transposase [Desulfuromonadales bacterium]
MARPLRIEFPGAVYHVTSRGNARADIFEDDTDRTLFLTILALVVDRYNWLCHAYCLMGNHYHLLIETPEGNLSAGMRQLNGVYTQTFNRTHDRDGHLFKGRYKSILVEKESYLLELARYIVLNPVRAGLTGQPEHFQWSSYLATLGKVETPACLTTDWLLINFSTAPIKARQQYRRFVADGITNHPSPWGQLTGQLLLGTENFVQKIRGLIPDEDTLAEIPRVQRQIGRPALEVLFAEGVRMSKKERNQLICRAYGEYGYTMKEIACRLGVHYTTVSKIVLSFRPETALFRNLCVNRRI